MNGSQLSQLKNETLGAAQSIPLFKEPQHEVYWVGTHSEGEGIECNAYLIVDGEEGYLLEPGGYDRFAPVDRIMTKIAKCKDSVGNTTLAAH